MGIDKVNRRQGTIQELIRLGEARIRDQTCFRWSIKGRALWIACPRWPCEIHETFIRQARGGKSVRLLTEDSRSSNRIRISRVAERSISNKAEKAERAFSYYIWLSTLSSHVRPGILDFTEQTAADSKGFPSVVGQRLAPMHATFLLFLPPNNETSVYPFFIKTCG